MSDWLRGLPNGGVAHSVDDGKAACGRTVDSWTTDGVTVVARCRRCTAAQVAPFMATESELSEEARAILGYARKWGKPFTRREIEDIAPGAAWDPFSKYPKTVAKLDPIRELVHAGMILEYDEQETRPDRRGNVRLYKRWALTAAVPSLAELLDEYAEAIGNERDTIRATILTRFGRG